MFSDTQKQVNKQLKYEKSKAYEIVSSLKAKKLSNIEILACIDVMSSADNNETQQEVLIKARTMVSFEVEQEHKYETSSFIPIDANFNN